MRRPAARGEYPSLGARRSVSGAPRRRRSARERGRGRVGGHRRLSLAYGGYEEYRCKTLLRHSKKP